MKKLKGFSLIEILVVITIFSFLGLIITRTIILTLSGAQKSDNLVRVRENIGYSFDVIERQLRNANQLTSCESDVVSARVYYLDQNNAPGGAFYCLNIGATDGTSMIASGSATTRLTVPAVAILSCTFSCNLDTYPQSLTLTVSAKDRVADSTHGSPITESRQIFLRNYH